MLKTFLQHIAVVVCKERLQKTPKILKNESILKIAKNGHQPKAIDSLCKILTFGQKLKIKKKHAKNVSPTHCSCSLQKTASKNI